MAKEPAPTPAPQPTTWKCVGCGRQVNTQKPRIPKGWKRRIADNDTDSADTTTTDAATAELFCPDCWKERYILRAISLPIAAPLDAAGQPIQWDDFRVLLRTLWAQTTQASNWMVTELYVRDARRTGEHEKLGPPPKTYLYPEARRLFPTLPPQTCAALEQAVKGKYNKKRLDLLWRHAVSLPTYRYPTPLPIHNQSWSVSRSSSAEAPVVSVRLGDARVYLKLRHGRRFSRQMATIGYIVSGQAVPGELAIYRQGTDTMCKMVAWIPRTTHVTDREGTLQVRTVSENLITAFNSKDEKLWTYNGDQIRRWIAEHRRMLNRWAEDSKAEQRPVPAFAERRRATVERQRRRMSTVCHTVASMIVNYAVRRKFAILAYDDSDHSFVEEFPWFDLSKKIQEKCDAARLEFVHTATAAAISETSEESQGPRAAE